VWRIIDGMSVDTTNGTPDALISALREASGTPPPQVLRDLVAHGADAIEPLRAFLRDDDDGYATEHVVSLLATLGAQQAIPDVVALYQRFNDSDVPSMLIAAVAGFGPPIVDGLIATARDPAISGYTSSNASSTAVAAAGADTAARARISQAAREDLAREIADTEQPNDARRARINGWVNALFELQDRGAAELMRTLDARGWLDREIVGDMPIDEIFDEDWAHPDDALAADWIERYAEQSESMRRDLLASVTSYLREQSPQELRDRFGLTSIAQVSAMPLEKLQFLHTKINIEHARAELARLTAPVVAQRKAAAKTGRNDPCPCGSGKKYKHCHG
jgi:hypothetical protein